MGGTLWVESEEGKGSTFHVELVADEADVPPRIAADEGPPVLEGKRLLAVDDNATNREMVSRQARSWAPGTASARARSEIPGTAAS